MLIKGHWTGQTRSVGKELPIRASFIKQVCLDVHVKDTFIYSEHRQRCLLMGNEM